MESTQKLHSNKKSDINLCRNAAATLNCNSGGNFWKPSEIAPNSRCDPPTKPLAFSSFGATFRATPGYGPGRSGAAFLGPRSLLESVLCGRCFVVRHHAYRISLRNVVSAVRQPNQRKEGSPTFGKRVWKQARETPVVWSFLQHIQAREGSRTQSRTPSSKVCETWLSLVWFAGVTPNSRGSKYLHPPQNCFRLAILNCT